MTLLVLASVLVAALLLAIAIRAFQRERPLLYLLIPVVMAFAAYSSTLIQSLLGYPTGQTADLAEPFIYIHHVGESPVYLLAIPQGADRPRLYEIDDDMSAGQRRSLVEISEKAKKGVPIRGRYAEGELVLHAFDAVRAMPKEQ